MLPAGASASCSEPPVLAKPGSACEPTKSAGSRKPEEPLGRLRLAPPLGTHSGHGGRGEGGSGAGRRVMVPTGRAAPHNGSWGRWASPHGVLCPPKGASPTAGAAGRRRRGAGLAPCMLHPWTRSPRDMAAGKRGDLEADRDPKEGVLWGARKTGPPTGEQGPWDREYPRGKRVLGGQGSPRVTPAPGKQEPEEGARDKSVPPRKKGVRGVGWGAGVVARRPRARSWQRRGIALPERGRWGSVGRGERVRARGSGGGCGRRSGRRAASPPHPAGPRRRRRHFHFAATASQGRPSRPLSRPGSVQPSSVPLHARSYLQEKASGCRSPMMERGGTDGDGTGRAGRGARLGTALGSGRKPGQVAPHFRRAEPRRRGARTPGPGRVM